MPRYPDRQKRFAQEFQFHSTSFKTQRCLHCLIHLPPFSCLTCPLLFGNKCPKLCSLMLFSFFRPFPFSKTEQQINDASIIPVISTTRNLQNLSEIHKLSSLNLTAPIFQRPLSLCVRLRVLFYQKSGNSSSSYFHFLHQRKSNFQVREASNDTD